MSIPFRRWLLHQMIRKIGFTMLVRPHIFGIEHIPPPDVPTIIMMNHSFTIDGVVVMGAIANRYVIPMVKIENMEHWFIGFLARQYGAFGIRRGEMDRAALKMALTRIANGEILLVAPEGTRQSSLQHPKDGLAYLALKSNAMIVPAALWNGESWYYDIKRPWRKTDIYLRFGQAFSLRQSSKRADRDAMHQMTQEMMYQLARLLPETHRGVYANLDAATSDYLDFR